MQFLSQIHAILTQTSLVTIVTHVPVTCHSHIHGCYCNLFQTYATLTHTVLVTTVTHVLEICHINLYNLRNLNHYCNSYPRQMPHYLTPSLLLLLNLVLEKCHINAFNLRSTSYYCTAYSIHIPH